MSEGEATKRPGPQRGLWLLGISFFAWMASSALLIPHLTPVSVDYFANAAVRSNASGPSGVLVCSEYGGPSSDSQPPAECRQGAATSVAWVAASSFVQNAVLGFAVAPVLAWVSDQCGRKPLYIASLLMSLATLGWATVYVMTRSTSATPFWPYYLFDACRGAINPTATTIAYFADGVAANHRTAAFSYVIAAMSAAMIVGAGCGGALPPENASIAAVVILVGNLVLSLVFLPESLSAEQQEAARVANGGPPGIPGAPTSNGDSKLTIAAVLQRGCSQATSGLSVSLAVVRRSSLFMRLAVIMALSGMFFECLRDVLFNFLDLTLGFAASDISVVMVVLGFSALIVQVAILPCLLRGMGEGAVLTLALVCSTLEAALLATAPVVGSWLVYTAICIGSLGSMSFPIVSSLKSIHASPSEQGTVQGALFGIRALAQGVGPIIFSGLFQLFTTGPLYFPSAPLIACALLMATGVAVAATMRIPPRPHAYNPLKPGGFDAEEGELLDGIVLSEFPSPRKRGESLEHLKSQRSVLSASTSSGRMELQRAASAAAYRV